MNISNRCREYIICIQILTYCIIGIGIQLIWMYKIWRNNLQAAQLDDIYVFLAAFEINYKICLLSHTKHLQINNLHIFTIVPFISVTFCFYMIFWVHLFFPFHKFDHQLGEAVAFSVISPRLREPSHPSWWPWNSSSLPIFRSSAGVHTNGDQICVPWTKRRLSAFPLTVYPDFDSC